MDYSKTKISACMMVKDEGKYIYSCIASIYPVVDEIVIVDTGSTDRTVAIIKDIQQREYHKKIKLHNMEWSGDFADMRQKTMELAEINPDYFMIIDGDEILDENYTKAGADEFRYSLELAPAPHNLRALFFCHRHYTENASIIDFEACQRNPEMEKYEHDIPGYFHTFCVRLFPNIPGIKYEGEVHELVEYSVLEAGITPKHPNPAVILHHYGNLAVNRKSKDKQNTYLKLLKKKTAIEPDNWRGWFELGNEHMQLGENKEAELAYSIAVEKKANKEYRWSKDVSEADHNLNVYRLKKLLAVCQIRNENYNDAKVNVVALRQMSQHPDLDMLTGLIYLGEKHYIQALQNFEYCLRKNPKHLVAMHSMAKTFEEMGNRNSAIMWYEKMLEIMPSLHSIRNKVNSILGV